jgi:hypothetical protein
MVLINGIDPIKRKFEGISYTLEETSGTKKDLSGQSKISGKHWSHLPHCKEGIFTYNQWI